MGWRDSTKDARTIAEQTAISRAARLADERAEAPEPRHSDEAIERIRQAQRSGECWWRDDPPAGPARPIAEIVQEFRKAEREREKNHLWWQTQVWMALHHGFVAVEPPKPLEFKLVQFEEARGSTAIVLDRLRAALQQTRGNQKRAGELIGMSSRQVCYFVKKYGLRRFGDWDAHWSKSAG